VIRMQDSLPEFETFSFQIFRIPQFILISQSHS
jgi:hypothetical protein